jgi:hypothetical protein
VKTQPHTALFHEGIPVTHFFGRKLFHAPPRRPGDGGVLFVARTIRERDLINLRVTIDSRARRQPSWAGSHRDKRGFKYAQRGHGDAELRFEGVNMTLIAPPTARAADDPTGQSIDSRGPEWN